MVSRRAWPPVAAAASFPRGVRGGASACRPRLIPVASPPIAGDCVATSRASDQPAETTRASGLVTLKTRADFLRVAGRRQRVARPGFVLQAAPAPGEVSGAAVRVGYTASRKVGNAVIRNRAK